MANRKKGSTVYDIARLAGVSASTVSRALNDSDYVSEEVKARVLQIARKLKYQPNGVARSLRTRKTGLIAFGVPNTADPFFTQLIPALQDRIGGEGYDLLIYGTDGQREKERKLLALAEQRQVDGVFLLPQESTDEDYHSLVEQRVPFVLFDARDHVSVDVVRSDDRLGVHQAITHLVEKGHRRIGFLGYEFNACEDRLEGYREALRGYGIPFEPNLVHIFDSINSIAPSNLSHYMAKAENPTAVFCAADIVAVKTIVLLQQLNYRIPNEISIVGFNDDFIAQVVSPKLTTVSLHTEGLARAACDLLFKRMKVTETDQRSVEKIVLPPRLVVRESTRDIRDDRSGE